VADYIIIVEHGRGEQGATGATGDVTTEALEAREAAEAARDEAEKWATEAQKNAEDIKTDIKEYVDTMDYLPLKPKIGLQDDDSYANIIGSFDFSVRAYNTVYPIHDSMGREVAYISAYNGVSSTPQVYLGYRMTDNQKFTFLPTPLRPGHLAANEVMDKVIGLGNEWIFYVVHNTDTDTYQTWLAKTDGSSTPGDWTGHINVTSIIAPGNWENLAPIYIPSQDVIVVTSSSSATQIQVAVYKSNLTSVTSAYILAQVDEILGYSGLVQYNSLGRRGRLAAFYDEKNEQLNVFYPIWMISQLPGESLLQTERTIYLPYKIPSGFLQTGTGTPALQLVPVTDYNWATLGKGLFLSVAGTANRDLTIVVDSFASATYFCWAQKGHACYLYRLATTSGPTDSQIYLQDPQVHLNFQPPDPCPWAKQITMPAYFMNGVLYNRGVSEKYGTAYYATEVEDKLLADNYLKFKTGSWWLPSNEEENSFQFFSNNMSFYRASQTETKWFFHFGQNTVIREVLVETSFTGTDGRTYKGRRTANNTAYTIPAIPSNYEYKQCCPDIARNVIYYIVADKVAADTLRQGYIFVLVYDMSTGVFAEYRDMPTEWDALCASSYEQQADGAALMYVYTSMLVDVDGSVYFGIRGKKPGDSISNGTYRIDRTSTPIVSHCDFDQKRTDGSFLGYDSLLGYFGQIYDSTEYSRGIIKASKNIVTGETKTRAQFFGGDCYTYNIGRDTGIGLIAYDLGTPILIGGYFSTTPEGEIYLAPNAVNYIYYSRDGADRDKVNIEVQTRKIGGEKAFNRVLVAEITTDSEKITAQTLHAVKWDY